MMRGSGPSGTRPDLLALPAAARRLSSPDLGSHDAGVIDLHVHIIVRVLVQGSDQPLHGLLPVLEPDDDVGDVTKPGNIEVLVLALQEGPQVMWRRPHNDGHARQILVGMILHRNIRRELLPELELGGNFVANRPDEEDEHRQYQVLCPHRHSLSPGYEAALQASQYTELRDRVNPRMNARLTAPCTGAHPEAVERAQYLS